MMIFFLFVSLFSLKIFAFDFDYKGHIKAQSLTTDYPGNSLFQEFIDDPSSDQNADVRLNFNLRLSRWRWQADYQLIAQHVDSVGFPSQFPSFSAKSIDDDSRVMDLTETISERGQTIFAHRFDRLHLTYTTEQSVFRLGRQAVSWGNGLVYTPMDFFNPFDPAAVDKEYKSGDDMLYAQHLFDDGNDLQAVWVWRRDEMGDSSDEVSSIAAKYHIFLEDRELDFLVAEHFDQRVIGIGGVANIGGSVWRGDIVSTEVDNDWHNSAVINVSYSWLAWGKNMSGHLEFYRNGFGIDDGDYSPVNLAQHPGLVDRILRGELFNLGRHNLAASATIELTPLWLLTATLFTNLDDDSNMLQLVSQHDLQQDLQLLIAVNIPDGDEGTEFGGIDSGVPDQPLSMDESLLVQLAYYF